MAALRQACRRGPSRRMAIPYTPFKRAIAPSPRTPEPGTCKSQSFATPRYPLFVRTHVRSRSRSTCSPTGNACFTAVCQDIYLETGRTYAFSAFAAARCNATGTLGCGGGYAPSANFYISPVGGSDMVRLKEGYTRIAYSLAYTDASTAAQACVYLTVEGVTAGVGLVALDDVQVDVK